VGERVLGLRHLGREARPTDHNLSRPQVAAAVAVIWCQCGALWGAMVGVNRRIDEVEKRLRDLEDREGDPSPTARQQQQDSRARLCVLNDAFGAGTGEGQLAS
jgi:hypothetical protein